MTDPIAHANREKARLIKAFSELDKARIREALLGLKQPIGSELQRVVRTEGDAIRENWPPLAPAYKARKARLAKAQAIGQFSGQLLRGLGRPTPRFRKSKTKTEVYFQTGVKHARHFTRGRFGGFVGGQALFREPRFIGLTDRAMAIGFDAIEDAVVDAIEKASRV